MTEQEENLMLDSLYRESNKETIRFYPLEISRYRLTVLTETTLNEGESVHLSTMNRDIPLEMLSHLPNYHGDMHMYRFRTPHTQENIEHEIQLLFNDHKGAPEAKLRAARFETSGRVNVAVRTFGIIGDIPMACDNLSKSGILLRQLPGVDAPFQVSTILEITIDPDCRWLEQPLECVGKVVRLDEARDVKLRVFGVQMIEMEGSNPGYLARTIDTLEQALAKDKPLSAA